MGGGRASSWRFKIPLFVFSCLSLHFLFWLTGTVFYFLHMILSTAPSLQQGMFTMTHNPSVLYVQTQRHELSGTRHAFCESAYWSSSLPSPWQLQPFLCQEVEVQARDREGVSTNRVSQDGPTERKLRMPRASRLKQGLGELQRSLGTFSPPIGFLVGSR